MIVENLKTLFSGRNSIKMALIVRTDLKLTKGKTASQCAHASVLCYQKSLVNNSKILNKWYSIGQPKIVLKVENLDQLNLIQDEAKKQNIICGPVCDAGRTQVESGTFTVLGLGPDYTEKIDAITEKLKLL